MDGVPFDPERRHDKTTKIAVLLIVLSIIFSFSFVYFHLPDFTGEKEYTSTVTIQDASELRGLEVINEVPVSYMSRRDFQEIIDQTDMDFERRDRVLLDLLFLYDIDEDLEELLTEEYGEGVGGYYDSQTKEIVVIEDTGDITGQLTLIHEFTHALQDQHFDLESYREADTLDREMAKHAVYEGDATFTMYEYLFELPDREFYMFMDEIDARGEDTTELPLGIENIIYFPYLEGFDFIWEVHNESGWDAVNRLYTDKVPMSTEHILHFDKYMEYEEPIEISWKPTVEGMTEVYNYTVGEFMIYTMLDNYIEQDKAVKGARGWGGDKLRYFENGTDFVSVFSIEWDTRGEALEFYETYSLLRVRVRHGFEEELLERTLDIEIEGNTTTIYYSNLSELPAIYP